jgi:hypothetical protein
VDLIQLDLKDLGKFTVVPERRFQSQTDIDRCKGPIVWSIQNRMPAPQRAKYGL